MEIKSDFKANVLNTGNEDQMRAKGYTYRELFFDLTAYLYILLFVYTAVSKIITYPFFLKILSGLPMVGDYYPLLAIFIISAELILGILLIVPKSRYSGLKGSLGLMLVFTIYLAYHIWTGTTLPCSCGGVISQMTWLQHLLFNMGFIMLALVTLIINTRNFKTKISTRGNR
ncbi:MauE/DoxX family redox-associated membrane protein [Pedobacter suwonensis]|uniref:MauE/DoxX family redox-associated membrane protein n=1 Tax=Pedobacter suwonensis TaxID=332999 RepID=UPI0036CC4989